MAGLIADIGATNARFAVADADGIHSETILKCADYEGIGDAIADFMGRTGVKLARASVAIAGPVTGDWFEMTNHVWRFSQEETRARFNFTSFTLMNDFKAIALGVPHLRDSELRQIGNGTAVKGAPMGVVGPGTGLGVASLFHDGRHYHAIPGEGGHVTMPARSQRAFDLFRTLRYKYRHVSAERVCSGKGLVNLYTAIKILDGREDLPDRTPEEISRAALDGSCDACAEALGHMIDFLGSVAGNLALTIGAHGGIYIAGGIVSQLGDYFYQSNFREQFLAKGRFADYLDAIPTFVILNEFPAFIGLHADLMKEGA